PYAVSSRWTCGLSPSPLVFTEALIPPCAQTECDRFTGTREIRSTGTLASQSLITVIRPASPPPTTITRRTLPPSLLIVLLAAIWFDCSECEKIGWGPRDPSRSSARLPLRRDVVDRRAGAR